LLDDPKPIFREIASGFSTAGFHPRASAEYPGQLCCPSLPLSWMRLLNRIWNRRERTVLTMMPPLSSVSSILKLVLAPQRGWRMHRIIEKVSPCRGVGHAILARGQWATRAISRDGGTACSVQDLSSSQNGYCWCATWKASSTRLQKKWNAFCVKFSTSFYAAVRLRRRRRLRGPCRWVWQVWVSAELRLCDVQAQLNSYAERVNLPFLSSQPVGNLP